MRWIFGFCLGCFGFALAQESKLMSIYTPFQYEACAEFQSSEWQQDSPIDFFAAECPGFAGYRVFLKGGDARDWLELSRAGSDLVFDEAVLGDYSPGLFPYVKGDLLEWRYGLRQDNEATAIEPYALIYRVAGQDVEDPEKEQETLIVIRLSNMRACLIGMSSSNEDARALADDETLSCP